MIIYLRMHGLQHTVMLMCPYMCSMEELNFLWNAKVLNNWVILLNFYQTESASLHFVSSASQQVTNALRHTHMAAFQIDKIRVRLLRRSGASKWSLLSEWQLDAVWFKSLASGVWRSPEDMDVARFGVFSQTWRIECKWSAKAFKQRTITDEDFPIVAK